jgi:hypothetical protein
MQKGAKTDVSDASSPFYRRISIKPICYPHQTATGSRDASTPCIDACDRLSFLS